MTTVFAQYFEDAHLQSQSVIEVVLYPLQFQT